MWRCQGDSLQSPSLPWSPPFRAWGISRTPFTYPEAQAPTFPHQRAKAPSASPSPAARTEPRAEAHLDGVLHVGGLVDAALAHRVGAHTNRLLYHVAITKNQVLPMELL